MPFQPVKAESLSAQVFETIRNAIFRGELKPGETLRELGLAKSLNVSQATVREALAHLEQYGLVVRTPNRSTNVTSFSPEEVLQRQKIRLALECLAFLEARKTASHEDLAELTRMADAISSAVQSGDSFAIIQSERQFHSKVWEISGNPVLHRMMDQLTTPLFVHRALSHGHTSETTNYRELVNQLRSGDRDSIQESLQRHVVDSKEHHIEHESETVGAATAD